MAIEKLEWKLVKTDNFIRVEKKFQGKHPNELIALTHNIARYMSILCACGHPQKVNLGYIHREKGGVKAVDQTKNKLGKLMACRLYFFVDVETKTLYALHIGDKKKQSQDVKYCDDYVKKNIKPKGVKNGKSLYKIK